MTESEELERPSYWSVKLYEDERERETIRGLTTVKKDTLMRVFDRLGVKAQALGYNEDGSSMLESETVNSRWSDSK